MNPDPLAFLTRYELALTPLDIDPAAGPVTGRARFHPNTRSGSDRRSGVERRATVRTTPDRRGTQDRRPRHTWMEGRNL